MLVTSWFFFKSHHVEVYSVFFQGRPSSFKFKKYLQKLKPINYNFRSKFLDGLSLAIWDPSSCNYKQQGATKIIKNDIFCCKWQIEKDNFIFFSEISRKGSFDILSFWLIPQSRLFVIVGWINYHAIPFISNLSFVWLIKSYEGVHADQFACNIQLGVHLRRWGMDDNLNMLRSF